jgi:hypothetical protein
MELSLELHPSIEKGQQIIITGDQFHQRKPNELVYVDPAIETNVANTIADYGSETHYIEKQINKVMFERVYLPIAGIEGFIRSIICTTRIQTLGQEHRLVLFNKAQVELCVLLTIDVKSDEYKELPQLVSEENVFALALVNLCLRAVYAELAAANLFTHDDRLDPAHDSLAVFEVVRDCMTWAEMLLQFQVIEKFPAISNRLNAISDLTKLTEQSADDEKAGAMFLERVTMARCATYASVPLKIEHYDDETYELIFDGRQTNWVDTLQRLIATFRVPPILDAIVAGFVPLRVVEESQNAEIIYWICKSQTVPVIPQRYAYVTATELYHRQGNEIVKVYGYKVLGKSLNAAPKHIPEPPAQNTYNNPTPNQLLRYQKHTHQLSVCPDVLVDDGPFTIVFKDVPGGVFTSGNRVNQKKAAAIAIALVVETWDQTAQTVPDVLHQLFDDYRSLMDGGYATQEALKELYLDPVDCEIVEFLVTKIPEDTLETIAALNNLPLRIIDVQDSNLLHAYQSSSSVFMVDQYNVTEYKAGNNEPVYMTLIRCGENVFVPHIQSPFILAGDKLDFKTSQLTPTALNTTVAVLPESVMGGPADLAAWGNSRWSASSWQEDFTWARSGYPVLKHDPLWKKLVWFEQVNWQPKIDESIAGFITKRFFCLMYPFNATELPIYIRCEAWFKLEAKTLRVEGQAKLYKVADIRGNGSLVVNDIQVPDQKTSSTVMVDRAALTVLKFSAPSVLLFYVLEFPTPLYNHIREV